MSRTGMDVPSVQQCYTPVIPKRAEPSPIFAPAFHSPGLSMLKQAAFLLCWAFPAFAQLSFAGAGAAVWLPFREIATPVRIGYGSSFILGSRQYCQLWVLLGLHHYQLRMRDTASIPQRPLPPPYRTASALEVAARLFPWHPTRIPFYAQFGMLVSAVSAEDANSPLGAGTSLGIGAVFPYSHACCSWFLEASAQYALWNVLLRGETRPIIRSWLVGLHLRLGL